MSNNLACKDSGVDSYTKLIGQVLFSFIEADVNGVFPAGGLVRAGDALFGTTAQGAEYLSGTMFKIAPPRPSDIRLSVTSMPVPVLKLAAPLGVTYRIESTGALPGKWSTVTNISLDRGPGAVSLSVGSGQEYFRAVVD